jgi:hypothetical protein
MKHHARIAIGTSILGIGLALTGFCIFYLFQKQEYIFIAGALGSFSFACLGFNLMISTKVREAINLFLISFLVL